MKETATPRKLAELLSAKLELPERDTKTRVVYLREAGLLPGGTFGDSKAPRLTLKAAALQLLACTAPLQIDAARHARRVADLQCTPARYENPELLGSGVENVVPLLKGNKTFISALVSLLRSMVGVADPLSLPVKGIGIIEGAGVVQAWIEPRMSTAWHAAHKAPQRIFFGRVGVIPLATFVTHEISLNVIVLFEVAQLFRGATAHQGDSPYVNESAPPAGGPSRRHHRETEARGVQPSAEVSAS